MMWSDDTRNDSGHRRIACPVGDGTIRRMFLQSCLWRPIDARPYIIICGQKCHSLVLEALQVPEDARTCRSACRRASAAPSLPTMRSCFESSATSTSISAMHVFRRALH